MEYLDNLSDDELLIRLRDNQNQFDDFFSVMRDHATFIDILDSTIPFTGIKEFLRDGNGNNYIIISNEKTGDLEVYVGDTRNPVKMELVDHKETSEFLDVNFRIGQDVVNLHRSTSVDEDAILVKGSDVQLLYRV